MRGDARAWLRLSKEHHADLFVLPSVLASIVEVLIVTIANQSQKTAARFDVLEARPLGLKFVGGWNGSVRYAVNDGVAHRGNTYCCMVAGTTDVPGTGAGWVLCCKAGRDGKDLRDDTTRR